MTIEDAQYPALLREISDPPKSLYMRGNPDALSGELMLAVVGTRKPTQYGKSATSMITNGLAGSACIVSGLALGVDAIAHQATLNAGGRTVAVLAGGVDRKSIGPRTNLALSDRILANGGALVSEHPPGTIPQSFSFPRRNRIVAGLCHGTVVIEAAEKSGALITSRLALEENRDVFAVPGPITSSLSAGTNGLIAAGATPVLGSESVLSTYGKDSPQVHSRLPEDPACKELYTALLKEGLSADQLYEKTCLNRALISVKLTEMELSGLVTAANGIFRIKKAI